MSCDIHAPLGPSDHNTVQVSLCLRQHLKNSTHPTKKIRLYSKVDLDLANQLLKNLPLATADDDIDVHWRKWKSLFMKAMDRFIPSKYVPVKSATPWITSDIRKDIAKRECLFRKAKHSNCNDHLLQFKRIRNPVVNKIKMLRGLFRKTISIRHNQQILLVSHQICEPT